MQHHMFHLDFEAYQNIKLSLVFQDKKSKTKFLDNGLIIPQKFFIHKCYSANLPPSWTNGKNKQVKYYLVL